MHPQAGLVHPGLGEGRPDQLRPAAFLVYAGGVAGGAAAFTLQWDRSIGRLLLNYQEIRLNKLC